MARPAIRELVTSAHLAMPFTNIREWSGPPMGIHGDDWWAARSSSSQTCSCAISLALLLSFPSARPALQSNHHDLTALTGLQLPFHGSPAAIFQSTAPENSSQTRRTATPREPCNPATKYKSQTKQKPRPEYNPLLPAVSQSYPGLRPFVSLTHPISLLLSAQPDFNLTRSPGPGNSSVILQELNDCGLIQLPLGDFLSLEICM